MGTRSLGPRPSGQPTGDHPGPGGAAPAGKQRLIAVAPAHPRALSHPGSSGGAGARGLRDHMTGPARAVGPKDPAGARRAAIARARRPGPAPRSPAAPQPGPRAAARTHSRPRPRRRPRAAAASGLDGRDCACAGGLPPRPRPRAPSPPPGPAPDASSPLRPGAQLDPASTWGQLALTRVGTG